MGIWLQQVGEGYLIFRDLMIEDEFGCFPSQIGNDWKECW